MIKTEIGFHNGNYGKDRHEDDQQNHQYHIGQELPPFFAGEQRHQDFFECSTDSSHYLPPAVPNMAAL